MKWGQPRGCAPGKSVLRAGSVSTARRRKPARCGHTCSENSVRERAFSGPTFTPLCCFRTQVAPVVKSPPANAGPVRDKGSIPGSGRSPGGGHGNPLQSSCLENPTDREAWQATVRGFTQSWAQPTRLSTHTPAGTPVCAGGTRSPG